MTQNAGETDVSYRRARVNRLKKIIIIVVFVLAIIPNLLCIILLVSLIRMNGKINLINERLEQYEKQLTELSSEKEEISFSAAVREERRSEPGPDQAESGQAEITGTKDGENRIEDSAFQSADGSHSAEIAGSAEGTENTEGAEAMENAGREEPSEPAEREYAHYVYLTFDDGPSIYTDEILDILAEYNIKATFFVVGKESEKDKERLRRIVEEGHTLGMHSYSHKYSELYATVDSFAEDFHKIQDYLYEVTGVESRFYRFPGGSSNTVSNVDMHKLAAFLDEQDVIYFDWNVSSGDADNIDFSVEELVANSTKTIEKHRTSVILFHDSASKRSTVDALPQVIENILAMEDTVILPITADTEPVQHNMK